MPVFTKYPIDRHQSRLFNKRVTIGHLGVVAIQLRKVTSKVDLRVRNYYSKVRARLDYPEYFGNHVPKYGQRNMFEAVLGKAASELTFWKG